MIFQLIQPDGKRMYINSDHINYMDCVGIVLTCNKTVPLYHTDVAMTIASEMAKPDKERHGFVTIYIPQTRPMHVPPVI